jgi:RNA polymerase sigma factor (sigma-70 family)
MASVFATAELHADRGFERVYRRHVRDVYAFSLGLLGNPDDAEDVTQTPFMNASRATARGDRVESPRAWLLAIAHNVCRQRFRTASRRPQEVELDAETAEAFVPDDATPDADEIRNAMSQLTFNHRTILVLREIEGLSYAEIATTMDLSESAVETLLFRARRALREQLEAAERPLSCDSAEKLISLQLDGRVPRKEKGLLRAHLRSCPDCASSARRQRAQRKAIKALAAVPLPVALATTGGFSLGTAAVAKLVGLTAGAAVLTTTLAIGTGLVPPPWAPAAPGDGPVPRPVATLTMSATAKEHMSERGKLALAEAAQHAVRSLSTPAWSHAGAGGKSASHRRDAANKHHGQAKNHPHGKPAAASDGGGSGQPASPGRSGSAPGTSISTNPPASANAGSNAGRKTSHGTGI